MGSGDFDIHARYVNALRTQAKTADVAPSDAPRCPYCNTGKIFTTHEQLFNHVKVEHEAQEPSCARSRAHVKDEALNTSVCTFRNHI